MKEDNKIKTEKNQMETDCESNLPAVLFDCLDFPAATTAPPKSGGAKAAQNAPDKRETSRAHCRCANQPFTQAKSIVFKSPALEKGRTSNQAFSPSDATV